MLMLTKHSLDLRLAKDLELGKEAREPHRPSMDGVLSFPGGTNRAEVDVSGKGTGLFFFSAPAEVQAASPFCLPSVCCESELKLSSAESCSKLWKLLLGGQRQR